MPIFYTQPPDKRKRKMSLFGGYFLLVSSLLLFSGLFFFELDQIHKLFYIVFGINTLFSGLEKIKGKQSRLIYIDNEKIDFQSQTKESSVVTVVWTDMRWIKKENDGGITIYRESSFSNHISLTDYSAEDQKRMIDLIEQQGANHNIRLINFSGSVSAVA